MLYYRHLGVYPALIIVMIYAIDLFSFELPEIELFDGRGIMYYLYSLRDDLKCCVIPGEWIISWYILRLVWILSRCIVI